MSGDFAIARYVARLAAAGAGPQGAAAMGNGLSLLGGLDPAEASLVDQWLDLALTRNLPELEGVLDAHLAPRSVA